MPRKSETHTEKQKSDLVSGRLNEFGAEGWNKLRELQIAQGKSTTWLLNYAIYVAAKSL